MKNAKLSFQLHFAHPDAYVDIYASPVKLNKDPELYNTFKFGWSSNVFTSTDPKEHAALKSMLGTFFSRQCVLKLEYVIQERIDKLISQLAKNHKSLPADMNFAFRSVTLDIITLYSFRTSLDATTFPAFRHPAVIGVEETMSNIWALKHLSLLRHIVKRIPPRLAMRLSPSSKPVLEAQLDIERLAKQAIKDCSSSTDLDAPEERNVFHTLLSSGKLEHTRSTVAYLVSEGLNLRVAGSDTVGNACTIGTRSLIADDRVRAKLVDELEKAWPDKDNPMPLERLEKLPYLMTQTAVIKESLRLSHGVVTPMTRVVPDSGAVIAGHPIPPGTIVSIANSFVNMSPEPFPEPTRFYPERWLEDKDRILERYLVSFGKGPRSCLGIK
ncbi:hypothetical protein VNI00_005472 [Paramarasmius palmivorus]|uniref:Cytochrome P450 n=1 Tax=Paramarasmius palmivorus TaxID=297713 RepID=A0AAW0DBQ4_9AGAR